MNLDPKVVKKQVLAEAQLHKRWGAEKTWNFLLIEIFGYDEKAAKDFMLSEDGGYTKKQVQRIIKCKRIRDNIYNQKLYNGRAEAF